MKPMLFLLLGFWAAWLPAKIPLAQAVRDAWEISRSLDNQSLEEEAAALAAQSAEMRKRFSVLFGGAYRYSSDNIQVLARDFPFALGPQVPEQLVILSAPSDSLDFRVSLLQPLYAGGRLAGAAALEAARGAAERHLTQLKRLELAGQVKAAFFSHRLLQCKHESLAALLTRLGLHVQKLRRLHDEELLRRSDLLEAMAQEDEARLGLQDLEQKLQAAAVDFQALCGHDPQEIDFQPAPAAGDFAAAWAGFLERHPLLRSLAERRRQLAAQRRLVAGSHLPQLSAFAEAHYARPGQNFFKNRWTFYLQGGLSLSLPLYNWNQRARDLKGVDIAGRKLENQRADFVRESEKRLRQLFLQAESVGRKAAILDGLCRRAAEEVELKRALYEEGQIDHTLLLAAMAGEERYRSQRGEAEAQAELLQAAIDTLIGKGEEE